MQIPEFDEIIEPNDQTEARRKHLEKLQELVGNVYPNKFDRSRVSGDEDTITRIVNSDEIKKHIPGLAEGERPTPEIKEAANTELKKFGNVRIAGRLATPPRLMGKAAFVHLSDGISRIQVYVRRDDVEGVYNGAALTGASKSTPPYEGGVAKGRGGSLSDTSEQSINAPVATAPGSDADGWEIFQLLDHGDFIGVEGFLFITNTGELSVHVEKLQFLAKAMLPMPDKMHGIEDAELKQRRRYADLIGSSLQVEHEGLTTREVFETRAKVISSMRNFLEDHGYIEVETPMLTPKATGAAAKPFETHHNALDITLYARIAPELYLKRLIVGGFEKVYELNRNFRNEGISYKHNPEFTMLEFYCAYMDVNGMMDFCEELMRQSVQKATGGLKVNYEGHEIDFSKPFQRLSMKQAIAEHFPKHVEGILGYNPSWLDDSRKLSRLASFFRQYSAAANLVVMTKSVQDIDAELIYVDERQCSEMMEKGYRTYPTETLISEPESIERWWSWFENKENIDSTGQSAGLNLASIFESVAERNLIGPTFIIDFPKAISPLSKASPKNPQIAERFELFVNGMEIANGFSELNDPKEQYERFIDQMSERERGDEEAMVMDEDYIRALSYGMPPAAGIGIGIDRLVMLLTNKHSIRDVILFPHLRPEKRQTDEEELPTN